MLPKETPDLDDLRGLFVCDFNEGTIRNKKRTRQQKPRSSGYISVYFRGKKYPAHRIIWSLYHNRKIMPHEQIDHINGNRGDNRIGNLRVVSPSENSRNTVAQKNPKNDYVGVTWDAVRKKWAAHIQVNRKKIRIGRFESIEEAASARKSYEESIGFNRIGQPDGNCI